MARRKSERDRAEYVAIADWARRVYARADDFGEEVNAAWFEDCAPVKLNSAQATAVLIALWDCGDDEVRAVLLEKAWEWRDSLAAMVSAPEWPGEESAILIAAMPSDGAA